MMISKWHKKTFARAGASGFPIAKPYNCLYRHALNKKYEFNTAKSSKLKKIILIKIMEITY